MRKTTYLLLAIILFSACTARKVTNFDARRNNEQVQKENSSAITVYKPFTVYEYIDRFKGIAIQEMNLYGIPASITIAQGLFESGNGNSELARVANNHFGIKTSASWTGKVYYKNDDLPNDAFRVLKKKNYAFLLELEKNDYTGWAYGLKKAGYATNPTYPQQLINIIQKYNLNKYDTPETGLQKIRREDRVFTQIDKNIGQSVKDSLISSTPDSKLYTVIQGDTLYNISKRFGLTVDQLRAMNNMGDNNIKIGQKLVVAK
jgi:hypothetical protein